MRRPARVLPALILCLVPAGCLAQGAAGVMTANHTLDGPAYSRQLLPQGPGGDFELTLLVGYTKPGVVLDTVGINAAPVGSWTVRVEAEGQLTLQVYDPALQSSWRNQSGWHVLQSPGKRAPGSVALAVLTVRGLALSWTVDMQPAQQLRLARPLAALPVWVGDFPGDDRWGSKYNIHPAMTGRLMVQLKPLGTAPPPVKPTPPNPPDDGGGTGQSDPDKVIGAVAAALKAADLPAVLALVQPTRREALGSALEASRSDWPKLSEWLAGGKRVALEETRAEYDVVVEGHTLAIHLVKTDGKWWLLSL